MSLQLVRLRFLAALALAITVAIVAFSQRHSTPEPLSACSPGGSIGPITPPPASTAASVSRPLLPNQRPVSRRVTPLPAALNAKPRGNVVITPQQAERVLDAAWDAREVAGAQDNAPMLEKLETGPAKAWDVAETNQELDAGRRTLRVVRPRFDTQVLVPLQHSYPACFLGFVQSTLYPGNGTEPRKQPAIDILVMLRESASAPWRIALHTDFTGTPLSELAINDPTPDPGHPGFDAPVSQPRWMPPAQAPQALAKYWQHWKDHDTPPPRTPFMSGTATTGQGRMYGSTLQNHVQPGGVRVHQTFDSDPEQDGLFEFAVGDGWDLTCSAIQGVAVLTPPLIGEVLYQTNTRPWGNSIPPGAYRSITHQTIRETCLIIATERNMGAAAFGVEGDHTFETGRLQYGPSA